MGLEDLSGLKSVGRPELNHEKNYLTHQKLTYLLDNIIVLSTLGCLQSNLPLHKAEVLHQKSYRFWTYDKNQIGAQSWKSNQTNHYQKKKLQHHMNDTLPSIVLGKVKTLDRLSHTGCKVWIPTRRWIIFKINKQFATHLQFPKPSLPSSTHTLHYHGSTKYLIPRAVRECGMAGGDWQL